MRNSIQFSEFVSRLSKSIRELQMRGTQLFVSSADPDVMWQKYLEAFDDSKTFRKRNENDCSACRRFIRSFGPVVAIDKGKVVTFWDFNVGDPIFQKVIDSLRDYVLSHAIAGKFFPIERLYGIKHSVEMIDDNPHKWHHMHAELLPTTTIFRKADVPTLHGSSRTDREVFQRSLDAISVDSIDTALDLISQNTLYRGSEWKSVLEQFKKMRVAYSKLKDVQEIDVFCWVNSVASGPVFSKIKNHSIGTFLTDLSEGMDLDPALRRYENVVAPANYKRSSTPATRKQIEAAEAMMVENGLMGAIRRRHATLDDITVNNTLFVNREASVRVAGSIFDDLKSETGSTGKKDLGKVEEIGIDKFISDVLPRANSLDFYLENDHAGNLVSLIAPEDVSAPSLFKWGNSFGWAYTGNVADSIRETVKAHGGNVNGVLRFSIIWSEDGENNDDFDAHCKTPGGDHIYFGYMRDSITGGNLDIDYTQPVYQCQGRAAVENIYFPSLSKLTEGEYVFYVNNYSDRGGKTGFRAELEFNGQLHQFEWPHALKQAQNVEVVRVKYSKKDGFTITKSLASKVATRKIWDLDTNNFHPVLIAMNSPNYWDGVDGIGNKHYFFMLKGAVNGDSPNGFFNEFLKQEFNEHRKVFEMLGSKMSVAHSDDQLSGVGFSSTKRASFIVKVGGSVNRTLKVKI